MTNSSKQQSKYFGQLITKILKCVSTVDGIARLKHKLPHPFLLYPRIAKYPDKENSMGRIPEGSIEEGGYKSPSVKHLWPHHKSMARLFVEGATPKQISEVTGFTSGHVSRILGSPAFQIELSRLSEAADKNAVDVNQIIREYAPAAIASLIDDLYQDVKNDDKARSSRQSAAKDILDRSGHIKKAEPTSADKVSLTQINIKEMKTTDLFTEVMRMIK